MQTRKRFILALGIAAALPLFADSKADPINKDGSGVAIKGYDPVAYFTQSKPVKVVYIHPPVDELNVVVRECGRPR